MGCTLQSLLDPNAPASELNRADSRAPGFRGIKGVKQMQQELIRMVAEKTGLSEEKARTAAETVIGYLKNNLPSGISSQLDSVTGGGTTNLGNMGRMAEAVGSKFDHE